MAIDIKSSIVSILTKKGKIDGTGFFAGNNLLITSAHTIENATQGLNDVVEIRWEIDSSTSSAKVLADYFSPSYEDDIAILQVDKIPRGVSHLPLGSSEKSTGHSFISFGYAIAVDIQGLMSKGEILGIVRSNTGKNYLQVSSAMLGHGMSGAPIVDSNLDQVVGMVSKGNQGSDIKGTAFNETAFAIPVETIVKIFPNLSINPRNRDLSIIQQEKPEIEQSINQSDGNTNQTNPIQTIRLINIHDKALDKHAATDIPVQNIKQDKLGFATYVSALHNFIVSRYTTTPLTIAIDGKWGSGKSSLMSMLKNQLEPKHGFWAWLGRQRTWWTWFLWWLIACPTQQGGRLLVWLFGKSKYLVGIINDIQQGLSINLDALTQTDSEALPKSVHFWATVRARCEPMDPPIHPTVWLNAWKFDSQEEVWASLALATLEQIKEKHNPFWRLWFYWDLTFSRLSAISALWEIFKKILLPLLLAILIAFYDTIVTSLNMAHIPLTDIFVKTGENLLWGGLIISGLLKVIDIFKDPFQISLEKVFDHPTYKDKVSFLTHFEKDFAKIIRSATKNSWGWKRSKLIIFIDDLDRCEPPKAADVIEAINLFLDAEGCIFVLGMDLDAVAMSVEVKYKDLFERMKAENAGVVSLGRAFLEKIVQIPFSVPRPTTEQIKNMVDDTLGISHKVVQLRTSMSLGTINLQGTPSISSLGEKPNSNDMSSSNPTDPTTERIDPASYDREEVRQAIRLGTELLSDNPRQVKTFINLFRLSIYIANERKILEERQIGEKFSGIGLKRLAIWVACAVRWQNLVRHLYTETQIDSLCDFLLAVTKTIKPEYTWTTGHKNIPDDIKKKFNNLRKSEKSSNAHWCHLPWDWWLLEPDFLCVLKLLEDLWISPEDELKMLLNMSRPLSAGISETSSK